MNCGSARFLFLRIIDFRQVYHEYGYMAALSYSQEETDFSREVRVENRIVASKSISLSVSQFLSLSPLSLSPPLSLSVSLSPLYLCLLNVRLHLYKWWKDKGECSVRAETASAHQEQGQWPY